MRFCLLKVARVIAVVLAAVIVVQVIHNIGAEMSSPFSWIPNAVSDFRQDIWGLVQRNDAANAREDAYNAQKEFAQHGIRWRVEDAKAAGLHPLYALGGAGATFSPSMALGGMPGGSSGNWDIAGQDVQGAARAGMTAQEQLRGELQLQLLRSQIEETDARAWEIYSREARMSQERNSRGGSPEGVLATTPPAVGRIKPKPDEVISQRPEERDVTAGEHAGLREYWITPNLKMRLPYSEEGPSEALENIPWYLWPAMIQHNRAYYGSDWGTRFMSEFLFGNTPRYRSEGVRSGSMAAPKKSKRWFTGRSSGR